MNLKTIFLLILSCMLLAIPLSISAKKLSDTVQVDCAKGDSIMEALENTAEELIIEISGKCQEPVVIQRDKVTLRGSDPLLDGIKGPTIGPFFSALVAIDGGQSVSLENLSITESEAIGLGTWNNAFVEVRNCRITGNNHNGAHISASSFVTLWDTVIADNRLQGIRVQRNAQAICETCRLENNGRWGLWVARGAVGILRNSEVLGDRGVIAQASGIASLANTSVTATTRWALYSAEQGIINWFGGEFNGSLLMEYKSFAFLQDVEQTANPGLNLIRDDSTLILNRTELIGQTTIETFANGQALNGTTLGNLDCNSGGVFFCDGSVTKVSSTCGLCL